MLALPNKPNWALNGNAFSEVATKKEVLVYQPESRSSKVFGVLYYIEFSKS